MTTADPPHPILAKLGSMTHEEMASMMTLLDELDTRKRMTLARNEFLAFIAAVDSAYKFGIHLKKLGALLTEVEEGKKDRIAVSMAPRFGKLLADDTPVWTPKGWTPHGELGVGDEVYHPSGHPVRVVAVSEAGPADMRVETTDGAVLYCHENHEWAVAHSAAPDKWQVLETKTLAERSLGFGVPGRRGHKLAYRLPGRGACESPVALLPIHPYMLGAWLGDGTATKPVITHAADDQPYIDKLVALGYPVSVVHTHTTTGVKSTSFAVGGKGRGNGSPLMYALRALELLGNKHIPTSYLTASISQRLELLAGLIDTDGTRDKTGRYTFTTVSIGLAQDVTTLVRSLGWRAGITEVQPRLSSSGIQGTRPYYMVSFNARQPIPVVLERKKFLKAPAKRGVGIASITRDPRGKVGRCIQVDSPDGMYLAGDRFTPTHNSQMISIYYPAWYLGKHPDHKLIIASHTVDLAVDMARKIRNLMQTAEYRAIFPGVAIAADAKAAGKWNTTKGGEVYATGVGGALAGRGAHLIVVDDPISEQDIRSGNTTSLDSIYEWFRTGLRTRLMPQGRIAILHCLVGDTPVTLEDGTAKPLKDIRPGDMVASYNHGKIQVSKVLGWANQGLDHIYAVALRSGVIIRGNERHPFLVNLHGVEQWMKIRDLKPGMFLVSTKGATDQPTTRRSRARAKSATTTSGGIRKPLVGLLRQLKSVSTRVLLMAARGLENLKSSLVCVLPALLGNGFARKTQTQSNTLSGTTENGRVRLAVSTGVTLLHMPKGCVLPVGTRLGTLSANLKAHTTALKNVKNPTSKPDMGLQARTTVGCLQHKEAAVIFVENLPPPPTLQLVGLKAGLRSITATIREKYGRYFAMIATSLSKTGIPQRSLKKPLSTLSITLDEIVSITPDGEEDVFDIQVDGTENFLAHGVVSHNTRWSQRDLIGRLIKDSALNEDGDQYEVFEFPAILEVANPKANELHVEYTPEEPATIQKSLWPAQWSLESLLRTKASMPAWQWNAQYQQNPTAQESAIIKKDDIQWWPHEDPPKVEFIVQAYDTALTTKTRSDYSVCITFGVWTTEEGIDNIICLNCVRGKYEFPELKKMALEQSREWEPDAIIVEAKASGQPLIDEMRRSGLLVQDYSPGKGQDKIARLNSVSDMFTSRQVWFPETRWASEVVDEILAFPAGDNDDQVDAVSLALIRIRRGGLLRLITDQIDTDVVVGFRKTAYY